MLHPCEWLGKGAESLASSRFNQGRPGVQNPYVVGRWVRGSEHYDRQSLIEHLLSAHDTAIWVVGTRRMGKTSLLRQIEHVTAQPDSPYVPLFWDLQGHATAEQLTEELCWAIESAADRFVGCGVDLEQMREWDAAVILRRLGRGLQQQQRTLLLLVDEAEVLVEIGQSNPSWLARLRKTLQEGHLRTIIASTRSLIQLTDQSVSWITSPFLFGFHMVILWPMRREGATALVRQLQSEMQVEVDDELVEQILHYTNHHPYLIQHLCDRLFMVDETGRRYLRPIEDEDLAVTHMLAGYFHLDFQLLSDVERKLLLAVAAQGSMSEAQLADVVDASQVARLPALLQSLKELGHLRREGDEWTTGSEFLRRWLLIYQGITGPTPVQRPAKQSAEMEAAPAARLDESNVAEMAQQLRVAPERLDALANVSVRSASEFFHLIRSFFIDIRHLVEQDDGFRLLVTQGPDGKPQLRSEEEIQIALKHWLRPMCRAANIEMDREAQTGRGFLDFKFSLGHDFRCLVEVKLFSSAKLQDGLGVQLPIYLLADRCTYGIYVPIFLEIADYEVQMRELHALATQRAQSHGVVIDVIDIRAWKPRSASKAELADDPARYQIAPLLNPAALAVRRQLPYLPNIDSPNRDRSSIDRPSKDRDKPV